MRFSALFAASAAAKLVLSSDSLISGAEPEPEACAPARPWERSGGVALYLLLVAYIFYGFEIICDEFFVPALNVTCEKLHIPDDVAGATIMALGSNMPDIFSGATGVLVLHTAVGPGTIVGSLLFNHLCIIGAAACAVRGGILLEWRSLVRELLFYAASIVLLLFSLNDEKITVVESAFFLVLYVVYIATCSLSGKIGAVLKLICRCCRSDGEHTMLHVGGELAERVPDLAEPLIQETDASKVQNQAQSKETNASAKDRLQRESGRAFEAIKERFADRLPSGTQVGFNYGCVHLHGYMWKKSYFYTKARISSRMWHKRWFALDEDLWYCRNPLFPAKRVVIPLWSAYKVEQDKEDTRIVHLYTPSQLYTFRAKSTIVAHQWSDALAERMTFVKENCPDLITEKGVPSLGDFEDDEESPLSYPSSPGSKALWYLSLAWNVMFTFTIPNVKRTRFRNFYIATLLLVIVWLGAMAYAMVWAAERFACIVGIPADIMGLSITAIGASLPSMFSSVIAAREGSAAMAVSNAFGANVCSILIAFGLPCFLQTAFVERGAAYHLASDSIPTAVVILSVALLVFCVIIAFTRLHISRATGLFFVFMYGALLALVILFNVYSINLEIPLPF